MYHGCPVILIVYACIVAFARISYFKGGLSGSGDVRSDIPVAYLDAAVFQFSGSGFRTVGFGVCIYNCCETIYLLFLRCGGEVPVIGVWLEITFLVCTQPVDGRNKEPVGGVRLQCSGREEVGVRYTVFAGGLYVYVFFGLVHAHRIGDGVQQVAPSYGFGGFQFIINERIAALAQGYDVAAECL